MHYRIVEPDLSLANGNLHNLLEGGHQNDDDQDDDDSEVEAEERKMEQVLLN